MNATDATICRLCLEDGEKKAMVPLLDECLVLTPTGGALSDFLDTKIKTDDNLPSQICKKCQVLLNQAIQFKQRCQTNYETLKSWSKNLLKRGADEKDIAKMLIQYATFIKHKKNIIKQEVQKKDTTTMTKMGMSVYEFHINKFKNIDEEKKALKTVTKMEESVLKTDSNKIKKDEKKIRLQKNNELLKRLGINTVLYTKRNKEKKTEDIKLEVNTAKRKNSQSFICEHCGKNFKAKNSLQMHLVKVHEDYTKCNVYTCMHCPYKSAKKLNVDIHMRNHTGERPFACDTCGQAFFRKSILRMHKMTHEEKKVPCNHCEAKFHTIGHLRSHINSAHIRQYVYQCYICNKTYAKIGTVRKHLVKVHEVARETQTRIKRVFIPVAEVNTDLKDSVLSSE